MRARSSLLLVLAALSALALAAPARAEQLVGLASGNQLVTFDSATPATVGSPVAITGLQPGESIVGIDFRPATGQLYGVGSSNRLYTIDPGTGAATAVGPPAFTLSGNSFGVDFNHIADRLRAVSDSDQNLLIDPASGAPVGSFPNIAFASGDVNFGQDPNVAGSAYLAAAPRGSRVLYGIDFLLDVLVMQDEDSGQLTTVGPLGVNPDALIGFDVSGSGSAYFVAGFPGGSFFHTVDLTTGRATSAGTIPIPNINGLTAVRPVYSIPPGPGSPPSLAGCPPETAARAPVILTDGNDTARGTPLGDLIFGGLGDDVIDGLAGDDCLGLGAGSDRGRGGLGNDLLAGEAGNDALIGDQGADRLLGGSGVDRLIGRSAADVLRGQGGGDRISGGPARDRISGGAGRDRIFGRRGPDRISGGGGPDRVSGGSGRDRISGDAGNDRILALDGGRDRITCGPGRDRVLGDDADLVAKSCELGP